MGIVINVDFKKKKRIESHNQGVLERFLKGETLSLVPPSATWFPPRPIIEKDKEAIKELYNDKRDNRRDRE